MNLQVFRSTSLLLALLGSMLLSSCLLRDPSEKLPNLYETMQERPDFSMFVEALDRTPFVEDLSSLFFTVMVPSNNVFQSWLDANNYANIADIPQTRLEQLIRYHFQQGKTSTDLLATGYYITPSYEAPDSNFLAILLAIGTEGIVVNGDVVFTETDIEAKNGFIHVIDNVLETPTIYELMEDNDAFSIFREAAERAGLKAELTNGTPTTVFLPTDQAFEDWFDDTDNLKDLDDLSDEELKRFMRHHLVSGNFRKDDMDEAFTTTYFKTMSGDSIRVAATSFNLALNDSVAFILQDIQGTNGVLHFINDVLDPK
ncbi:MAG: fasciclin domain-containing protein [Bacteroidota bacterium]